MIPRNEIVALEINESIEELKSQFLDTGFSRILIFKDNIDNIIGYVHSTALFKSPENIKSALMPVGIIPEAMAANHILEDFIAKNRNLAIVVDEFGGTSGIVTMEDIIEEIFGEIDDEHDQELYTQKKLSTNEFVFSARLEIDMINEKYRLGLPEKEDYETLGGLIINIAETIPQKGDEYHIDHFHFQILEVEETKIVEVYIKVDEENS